MSAARLSRISFGSLSGSPGWQQQKTNDHSFSQVTIWFCRNFKSQFQVNFQFLFQFWSQHTVIQIRYQYYTDVIDFIKELQVHLFDQYRQWTNVHYCITIVYNEKKNATNLDVLVQIFVVVGNCSRVLVRSKLFCQT